VADQLHPRRGTSGTLRQDPGATPSKEARDTVAGCRDRAAQDRLQAAGADTENGRRVFERSAASWEARADEMQEGEDASAQQRAVDRDLWVSGERNDPASPD
jgi:hypothetical protein